MEPVSLLALSALLILAMWKDMTMRKIPNSLVLWGVITAVVLSMTPKGIGLGYALAGGTSGFLIFLFLYLFKMVGAGDVKLVAATGMFIGWSDMANVCVSILIAGGVVSIFWAILNSKLTAVLKNIQSGLLQNIRVMQMPQIGQDLLNQVSHERVPYALAIGLGTAAYILMSAV